MVIVPGARKGGAVLVGGARYRRTGVAGSWLGLAHGELFREGSRPSAIGFACSWGRDAFLHAWRVPAKQLYEIVKSLPENDAVLKRASNNYLELRSGAAEFRIVRLPADVALARDPVLLGRPRQRESCENHFAAGRRS